MRKIIIASVGVMAAVLSSGYGQAATEAFHGTLSGATEVPATNSAGKGTAAVNFDAATKMITYNVTYSGLSGPATAAHIHCGAAAGANAGVAVPFPKADSPITGNAQLTDA